MTEDEMVGWHHLLSGREFESKLWEVMKDREAWRAACSPWGCRELYTTPRLNRNNNNIA